MTFDRWTVTEDYIIENRQRKWKCKCSCGTEKYVYERNLLSGRSRSCGCYSAEESQKRVRDLTGMTFGKLTVIRRAPNRKNRVCWECRCECGNTSIVTRHELVSGKTKSCGCSHHIKGKYITDITGNRYGRLVAEYPTENRNTKGSVFWHCKCDCGTELEVTYNDLVYGRYRSCGCLKKEVQKNLPNNLHRIDGTCVEWMEKRKSRSDNTSGFRGVNLTKRGRYQVVIGFKGKRFYLGSFRTFEEAKQARLEAEELIHDGFVKAYYEWTEKAAQDSHWSEEHPFIFEVQKTEDQFVIRTE